MDDWISIVYGDLFSVHRALFLALSLLYKWTIRVTSVQSEWVMSHIFVMLHIRMSHVAHMVMLHIRMSHVAHMVMLHIRMSLVTHVNESCHTYDYFISTINAILNGPQCALGWMKESCDTHEGVRSHTWRSHVTHMTESCHSYERVMSHIWTFHVHINAILKRLQGALWRMKET